MGSLRRDSLFQLLSIAGTVTSRHTCCLAETAMRGCDRRKIQAESTESRRKKNETEWRPPRLAELTYAATWTLISFALASSRSGSRTVSTPALYSALTLLVSTVGGSANVRANEP